MTTEQFEHVAKAIRPFTDYVYLHVLGEPMLHPHFLEIVRIAKEHGLYVNLTTNGSLISKVGGMLPIDALRQCNVSVHALPDNVERGAWHDSLITAFDFAKARKDHTYFSFRLWNSGTDSTDVSDFNAYCIDEINQYWGTSLTTDALSERNVRITDHVFLQNAARFSWPGEETLGLTSKRCYGMRDHVAILSDGRVVPCCLDGNGVMTLGNVFESDFGKIIACEMAETIRQKLSRTEIPHRICSDCGFKI